MEHIKVENGVYIVNAKEEDLYTKVIGNIQYIFQLKHHYTAPLDYTKKLIDLVFETEKEWIPIKWLLTSLTKTELFDVFITTIATCSHPNHKKSTDDTNVFYRDSRIWHDIIVNGKSTDEHDPIVIKDKATKEVLSKLSLNNDRVENLIAGGVINTAVYVERPWTFEVEFTTSVDDPLPDDYLKMLSR